MIRLSIACLVALAAAMAVAWKLGGTQGAGVLAGFALGAGFSGLTVLYQRHVLLTRPSKAFHAFFVCFFLKLAVLLTSALTFRFVEAAAQRADWKTFLIAFAAAVLVVVPLGLLDVLAKLRERQAATASTPSR